MLFAHFGTKTNFRKKKLKDLDQLFFSFDPTLSEFSLPGLGREPQNVADASSKFTAQAVNEQ